MKQFIYILMVLFFPVSSIWSQTSVPNYIITTIPTSPVTDPTALVDNGSSQNSNSTIQYFDGLGRPTETVQKGITPTGKDLVALTEYDGVGREYLHWLPVANAGSGAYVDAATFKTNAGSFYSTVANDSYPYTTTEYEASPLNRVTGQYGAGAAWNNPTSPKKVKTEYGTNAASEVAYFHVDGSSQLVRGADGYAASTLYKTTVTDEDGKTTAEYKDKQGRVVMVRRGADVDTYWVYNDLGQLAYVLPPLAADNMTATTPFADTDPYLKKYGYLYKYDGRGNCIEKRLPGCEPIHMLYDQADRLVLSQDGNQRLKTQWTVTKCDVLGRVLYTGVLNRDITQEERDLVAGGVIVETAVTGNSFQNIGYTAATFNTDFAPLSVNYYDDYGFMSVLPQDKQQALGYQAKDGYSKAYPEAATDAVGLNAKGLLTGTRTYILDGSGNYTSTAMYYDDKSRVVQTRSTNHMSGYDKVYNQYNFAGQVTKSLTEHSSYAKSLVTELYTHDYDQAGRLLKTRYKFNNNPEIALSDMTAAGSYDELGRLAARKRHGGADTESFA
ncbi:MAG TPA: DUF6443 domain-containing protein, partial [Paludibacter sp.]|nr:DUF6443 domain-containing protein [Paludibacter sp.]